MLLREQGVSFPGRQDLEERTDPDYEATKNRVLELYAIADGRRVPGEGDPNVVICTDEFGPLNPQPHPGRQWAPVAQGRGEQSSPRRRRLRATYKRPRGVRHLMAGYDPSTDRLYGHMVKRKGRTEFLAFARYLRSLHPAECGSRSCWTTSGSPGMNVGHGAGRSCGRRSSIGPQESMTRARAARAEWKP